MPFEQLLFDFAQPLLREKPAASPSAARSRRRVQRPVTPPARGVSRAVLPQEPRSVFRLVDERIDGKRVMPQPPRGIDHARPVQRRYDGIVEAFLSQHGLRVRCWRRSLSGLATLRIYRDGRQERTIESPYPTSPLRLAIFLHEVGHHVIGLGVYRPRSLEEYHAWRYAIDRMNELGVPTDGTVQRRFERAMRYAVAKSARRGIRALPVELVPFAAVRVAAATR
jgi:hypothetical protein